jgi:hypothetical protein
VETLASIPPSQIGYVQLCDAPMDSTTEDYYQEACFGGQIPGEGELPLVVFLKRVPGSVLLGLEIPMRSHTSSQPTAGKCSSTCCGGGEGPAELILRHRC